MKICVACAYPGGPDATIADDLEMSEILDYYDLREDCGYEHVAQTRKCLGGCSDLIESIVRREVDGVIVTGLSPTSLLKLKNGGVKVFLTEDSSVKASIDLLCNRKLKEIGIDQFSKLARKHKEEV
jgi:predicted Fe-Mo cluster-binding NifX family protein